MSDGSFICIDPFVPLELTSLADDRAVEIRPDNDGSNLHAAGDRLRFWGTGMSLRVRFLDSPDLAERVMDAAAAWTDHANLEFRPVDRLSRRPAYDRFSRPPHACDPPTAAAGRPRRPPTAPRPRRGKESAP